MGRGGDRRRWDRCERPARAFALLALVVLLAPSGQAAVLEGPGEDLPVLVDETVDGGMAVTLTLELSGPAQYRIDLIGEGPRDGSVISMGFLAFDAERDYEGMIAITSFRSAERQRTVVAGEAMPAPTYDVPEAEGEPLSAVLGDDETRERACPLACASRLVSPDDSEGGLAHHGLWLGGVDRTRLQVMGDENVEEVHVREGTPVVAGTERFADGTANVQHQPTTRAGDERAFAGAKAVHEARHEATVEHELYGAFGLAEFKHVCAGSCVSASAAKRSCGLSGADCRVADVAWQGPETEGAPANGHVFRGNAPGAYTFEAQGLVDAWARDTPVVAGYAWADPGEHHVYLSAADVPRPPVPR